MTDSDQNTMNGGIMQSNHINELAAALALAQGAMSNAVMNRTNPHFKSKYADLSSVLDAIRAPLSANGLSVVQTMRTGDMGMVLRTTLMHASGQYIATEYPLPSTQRPHEIGSALTYARRYSLAALICNSADEDDDGNVAQSAKPTNGNEPVISEEQVLSIRDMIESVGADRAKFLAYLKVDLIEAIPASRFDDAMAKLKAKAVRNV